MSGTAYHYTDSAETELILTEGEGRSYPRHIHIRHWTIGVVNSGTVTITTDTGTRELKGGEQFLVRPYEPHSLTVAPESSLLVFCFENISVLSLENDALRNVLCRSPSFRGQERLLIKRLAGICSQELFLEKNKRADFLTEGDTILYQSVQAVASLIIKYPEEFTSVEQMARYAGYSQWYFLRAFQKFTGMTPHAFQLLCRLRMLRGMLRADTESAMAAVSAGFSDQSHMHKVFKRHHGMTPGEFRQANFRLEL